MPQCKVFWPLQLNYEISRVPVDSQIPISGVWVSSSHSSQSRVVTHTWQNSDTCCTENGIHCIMVGISNECNTNLTLSLNGYMPCPKLIPTNMNFHKNVTYFYLLFMLIRCEKFHFNPITIVDYRVFFLFPLKKNGNNYNFNILIICNVLTSPTLS
jgi:hypothetical protein